MPLLDRAVTALVDDLHERGLDKDVSVVVWGEFGRTPRINNDASRDHWPQVSCALLAGGGMRTGQVIGATDNALGEHRGEAAGDAPGSLRHALPQPRPRPEHGRASSTRTAGRSTWSSRARADARGDLTSSRTYHPTSFSRRGADHRSAPSPRADETIRLLGESLPCSPLRKRSVRGAAVTCCASARRRSACRCPACCCAGAGPGGEAPVKARAKSVIVLFLSGGPSQLDMLDLKPDAPEEIRGTFRPIATSVPGVHDLRAPAAHGAAGATSSPSSAR